MDYLLAGLVGVGLAAACGLRAFVPVLGLALAAKAGWVGLGPSFAWLGTWPAIAALGVATIAEIAASIAPLVGHALDAIAAPVACAAGSLVMASQLGGVAGLPDLTHVDPLLQWGAALIAGGGVAGIVHTASAALRAGSTGASAGLLSPIYGAIESATSIVAAALAIVIPALFALVTLLAAGCAVGIAAWFLRRRVRRRSIMAPATA